MASKRSRATARRGVLLCDVMALPHVEWAWVEGDRLHVTMRKFNGAPTYNKGRGYRMLFVNMKTGHLTAHGVAGETTRAALQPTLDAMTRLTAAMIAEQLAAKFKTEAA